MARFFVISINYAPESTGFGPHAAALAEHLAHSGHEVSVFTGFPFAPEWRRRTEDRGRWYRREGSGNLIIHRLTHYIPRRPSSASQRLAMEGSFAGVALLAIVETLMRVGRPAAVLYIGAQPAIAMLARIVSTIARCPYVVNINDLAASAAHDVGIIGRRLHHILEGFEFAAYRKAAMATVLSPSFEEALVEHGYPRDRIRVIRSPIDLDRIRPTDPSATFRVQYGIPEDAFLVLQAGSMGRKQGLGNVVSAAALARGTRIRWVLVGDGETRQALMDATRAGGLEDSVRFVPFQPEADMAGMFAAADVLLLNQVGAVKDTVIPSKLLTYMAAGACVLAAVNPNSQGAEIIRESGGGIIVPPERPEALAAAAQELMALPRKTLKEYGARNRAYAEMNFDQRTILAAHEAVMLSVARKPSDPGR